MRVVVLTSSRADYSIYFPLLNKLVKDAYFNLSIIAFGTHLSDKHGYTLHNIVRDGFQIERELQTTPLGDSPYDISKSVGETIIKFSELWSELSDKTDLIICLGDRFEMFAAITASVPFNIPVAHIHGGETTLGAIDNTYRHCLTLIAKYHFASTQNHADRIAELKGTNQNIYCVGSLGLENLSNIKLLDAKEFETIFSIPIKNPVLVTFHPETVDFAKNEAFAKELVNALTKIENQIIITMPNADTMGNSIRKHLTEFANNRTNVFTAESLGMQGYYSCLSMCDYVLGNSSSGIIEAASFGKYVIDIGNRQKGRDAGKNIIHCAINSDEILHTIHKLKSLPKPSTENIYWGGEVSLKILNILKNKI
jgi:GDP/UDP-N,N'-diacetylbacillosamine 2-epimerase (hydrolysing)